MPLTTTPQEPYHRWYLQSLKIPRMQQNVAFILAGRVFLGIFDVPHQMTIDHIGYQVGTAQLGNIRLGLYNHNPVTLVPDGEALVVETGSVAQIAVNSFQQVQIADTLLARGTYWVAIQGSNVGGTFYGAIDGAGTLNRTYDRGGGYGAFTDPCPVTGAGGRCSFALLRVVV